MSIRINTLADYNYYRDKGYRFSIDDICFMLGVSIRKAKTLLTGAPRLHITEDLYYRLKKRAVLDKAYRYYYDKVEVVEYLIREKLMQVYYGDARKIYTQIQNEAEEHAFLPSFLIKNINMVYSLLEISRTTKEIVINNTGYDDTGQGMYADLNLNDFKHEKELYTNYDLKKCEREIKKDFYIKFKIGKTYKYFYINLWGLEENKNIIKEIPTFINNNEVEYLAKCK